ncbi:MAG TPA: hypothetical protein VFX59_26650 [Polyangiales bacterium]|nr:hypothetical protein [Polyangiales bacterium]
MLLHVSMPADDCRRVAETLAEMMEGEALRFPPGGPDAWNVWSGEIQLVVTPRGHYLVPGEMGWRRGATQRASETHFALGVRRPAHELLAIAGRAGWPAQICDRGGFFEVVELWVEGAYLVELLDPTFLAAYQRSMTVPNWKAVFGAKT